MNSRRVPKPGWVTELETLFGQGTKVKPQPHMSNPAMQYAVERLGERLGWGATREEAIKDARRRLHNQLS